MGKGGLDRANGMSMLDSQWDQVLGMLAYPLPAFTSHRRTSSSTSCLTYRQQMEAGDEGSRISNQLRQGDSEVRSRDSGRELILPANSRYSVLT